MSPRGWLLAAVFYTFILDVATTLVAFKHGALESNPFLADFSIEEIALAKGVVFVFLAAYVLAAKPGQRMPYATALFGIAATWAVVGSNLIQLSVFVDAKWGVFIPLSALLLAGCLQTMIKPGSDAVVGNV